MGRVVIVRGDVRAGRLGIPRGRPTVLRSQLALARNHPGAFLRSLPNPASVNPGARSRFSGAPIAAPSILLAFAARTSTTLRRHNSLALLHLSPLPFFRSFLATEWPWVDYPHQEQDPLLIHLYIAQLAVWTYTAVVCVWVDERRKDYQVMLAHHVVTIGLVSGSLSAGLLRIGLLVLYVNDTSDVFVDLLKMTNYLKLEGRRGWFGSEIAFINMMLAWLYWRLYEFPTYVLKSSIIAGRRRWDLIADRQHWTDYFDQPFPLYWQMNSLLLVLLGLYFWWFYLMARILVKMATGSVRQASREEYEGDSEDEAGHDAGTSLMVDAINRSADTRAPVASAAGFSSPTTEPIVAGGSPAKGKAKGAKQQ